MVRRSIFPSLLSVFTLLATSAVAQEGPSHPQKPLAATLQGTARDAYGSARLLFKQGDFAGAANKYEQAYGLSKDPRLLFDMAICEKNLRAYARMQGLLEQYKREGIADMSADDRATVDGALAAVKNLVGTLTLTVDARGASVTVDGQSVGTTPLAGHVVLDLGKHVLVVQGTGMQAVTREVSVVGGADTALTLTIKPEGRTAHVIVAAEPDAMITLDGNSTSKARFDAQVAAGTHEIRVTEDGKVPYEADVDLKAGETRTLQVTLTSESHPTIWPWIVGGAVVAAGAAVGGYFLFRPSDQTLPVPTGASGAVQFAAFRFR
jgi:hypothetical protein